MTKKELAKILIKRLEDDGFQYHLRLCEQSSHYGGIDEDGSFVPDDELVREKWKNEEFVNWLLDIEEVKDLLKENRDEKKQAR